MQEQPQLSLNGDSTNADDEEQPTICYTVRMEDGQCVVESLEPEQSSDVEVVETLEDTDALIEYDVNPIDEQPENDCKHSKAASVKHSNRRIVDKKVTVGTLLSITLEVTREFRCRARNIPGRKLYDAQQFEPGWIEGQRIRGLSIVRRTLHGNAVRNNSPHWSVAIRNNEIQSHEMLIERIVKLFTEKVPR